MDKLPKYLPFHFLIALIFGICIQFFTQFWSFGFTKLYIVLVILLLITLGFYYLKKQFLFTICSWLLFCSIGISSTYMKDSRNYKHFYSNLINDNAIAKISIKKVLKSGNYNDKYLAELLQINNKFTKGTILLNIKKDSIKNNIQVDNILLIPADFTAINSALNPYQFNYKKYLKKQDVYHQIFVDKHRFKIVNNHRTSLLGLSAKFRNHIQKTLKKYGFTNDEYAVINALLLGQRQEISKELSQDYTRAGAIHILAVSGLHVGIILLILSFLFKPLEHIKNGRYLKTLLIVICLWMFAFIAGLSASVIRAVTMFTFVAIGQTTNRQKIIEHSLIASMFLLLLIKPMFLFDIGFQLSYLAVFSIVWFQPLLYSLWKPRFFIPNKFWQLTTVSVSAQIGILPISLYYFHQFPSLFIVANLVIIPCLGTVLFGGILIIFLALLNILPQQIASLYETIIKLLNSFVSWISLQEDFLLKEISMSFLLMLAWYAVIFFALFYTTKRKPKRFVYFLISIICLQSVYFFEKHKTYSKKEFIVFHKSRKTIIGDRIGKEFHLFSDIDSTEIHQEKLLTSYKIGENIQFKTYAKQPNIFIKNEQQILVIDSLGIYNVKGLNKPIVVLQQSPKINLKRLINTLQPTTIVADGSNYKSYVKRWMKTCKKEKTPFYQTDKNGAYILSK